mmetsp:Transcript_19817/g.54614  ORF Transcript_19817/g.54614 Transcript_19817/m.54614 type:complete len:202 (-) Transcript_19817:124-729(-)
MAMITIPITTTAIPRPYHHHRRQHCNASQFCPPTTTATTTTTTAPPPRTNHHHHRHTIQRTFWSLPIGCGIVDWCAVRVVVVVVVMMMMMMTTTITNFSSTSARPTTTCKCGRSNCNDDHRRQGNPNHNTTASVDKYINTRARDDPFCTACVFGSRRRRHDNTNGGNRVPKIVVRFKSPSEPSPTKYSCGPWRTGPSTTTT